jgi:hypothetical protein
MQPIRFPALSSAGASTSRSSNRACGFLAHGSPTGFSHQHTMALYRIGRDSENIAIFAGKYGSFRDRLVLVELIGKANLRTVGLFQQRARSQAPFLHRHYPASTVVRACPPPHTTEPAPHGVLVESHDLSPLGLPVFRRFPLPCMPAPLPRRNRPMLSLSCRAATAFPVNQEGQLPRFPFRGLLGVHSRSGLHGR